MARGSIFGRNRGTHAYIKTRFNSYAPRLPLCTLITLALLTGCTPYVRKQVSHTLLVTSTASLACDWHKTSELAWAGWPGFREKNVLLGERPSGTKVDLYFAGVMVANVVVGQLLPEYIRPSWYGLVTFFQVANEVIYYDSYVGVCGI